MFPRCFHWFQGPLPPVNINTVIDGHRNCELTYRGRRSRCVGRIAGGNSEEVVVALSERLTVGEGNFDGGRFVGTGTRNKT